jgi:hypothetical protein
MSVTVTLNGVSYTIPTTTETGWGSQVTAWIQSASSNVLQKSGGTFTLTAEASFGATYGLMAAYYKSTSSNIADSGAVRLARTDEIKWRNEANDANLELGVNSSDQLTYNGNPLVGSSALTGSRALQTSAGGAIETSSVTSTELGRLSGVASAVLGKDDAGTLTNKTIAAANNTISGLLHGTQVDNPTTGVHGVTGSVVGTSDSQTLTNKTLDGAIVANGLTTASNANLLLDPHGTGSIEVGAKVVGASNTTINIEAQGTGGVVLKGAYTTAEDFSAVAGTDNTKLISFDPSGQTENTSTTLAGTATDLRTITLPDADTTLVGHDTTDTLTNKTFDDAVTLKDIASPTTPDSGYGKIYFKGDKLYQMNDGGTESEVGSGSGGGGINYVTNGEFETNVDGWDDSGGTLTITRSATTPLRGTASGVITNGANNDYIKYPFTIADADKAKILRISFDINTGALADNELQVSIYDATNAVTISVVDGNIKAGVGRYIGEFQTASNSNSYELRITQIAEASGWTTVKIDNVQVGPREIARGSVVTDWVSYTPVITTQSGTITNFSPTGRWRRVGDMLELDLSGVFTSASVGTWSGVLFGLPSGLVIDTSKTAPVTKTSLVGSAILRDAGTGNYQGNVRIVSGGTTYLEVTNGLGAATQAAPFSWGDTDAMNGYARVPIVGWSSNTTMSTDFGGRVIAANYAAASGVSTDTSTPINFATKRIDKTSSVTTGAAWKFTAPESGVYVVAATLLSSSGTPAVYVYKNGVTTGQSVLSLSTTTLQNGVTMVELDGGQYIDLRAGSAATLFNTAENTISIHKIQSPQTLMGGEVEVLRAVKNSGTHTSTGNWQDVAAYDTEVFDSHGSFNPTTGIYTFAQAGKYLLSASVGFVSNVTGSRGARIDTTAGAVIYGNFIGANTTGLDTNLVAIGLVNAVAGNTAQVVAYQNCTANLNYGTTANSTGFSIMKVN